MRRPKTFVLLLALLLGAVIVFWPARPPEPPEAPKSQTTKPPPAPQLSDLGKPADLFYNPPRPDTKPEIDPTNQQKADALNAPEHTIQEDLRIVGDFVDILGKAYPGAALGDNADITAALTGTQYPGQKGHVFPRFHNAIRGGQLVDRWGSPFWFHANGPGRIEIRSAGPDRQLFTPDDVMQNPSPAGLGVTPAEPPSTPP